MPLFVATGSLALSLDARMTDIPRGVDRWATAGSALCLGSTALSSFARNLTILLARFAWYSDSQNLALDKVRLIDAFG